MGKHDDTCEFSNRELRSRRLRAVLRLRRIRNERHGWRFVTAGLVGAIVAGSVLSSMTGKTAAAEAAEAESSEGVEFVQASYEVDAVIDDIAARQRAEAAAAEAKRLAEEQAAAEAQAKAEAEAKAQAEAEAEAKAQAEAEAAKPDWISPSTEGVTSLYGERWGRLHAGMDFANDFGDQNYTIADGTVTYAGWFDGYGNLVVVDHGDGVETAYAHAEELKVSVGDKVEQGQTVSMTGNTGNSTAPHLHFEVRINGEQVDPLAWLEDHDVAVE